MSTLYVWLPRRIIRFFNIEGIGQAVQLVWHPSRIRSRVVAVWLPNRITRFSNRRLRRVVMLIVWQPYRTTDFLLQRPRTGFPVRLRVSTGFRSRPQRRYARFRSHEHGTPSVPYAGNSDSLCLAGEATERPSPRRRRRRARYGEAHRLRPRAMACPRVTRYNERQCRKSYTPHFDNRTGKEGKAEGLAAGNLTASTSRRLVNGRREATGKERR